MIKIYEDIICFLILVVLSGLFYCEIEYVYAEIRGDDKLKQFQINGAGASFPFPLIDLWRVEYEKIHPNIHLNYQSIGSGGGIKQHIEKIVDFAATDIPMKENEMKLTQHTLHIPETIGAITLIYNIPEIPYKGLKLSGAEIADIYLGKITKWNDHRIKKYNESIDLPDADIIPIRRSDSSGTTYVFTDYLSTIDDEFYKKIGKGKSVPWGNGIAAIGNEGVSSIVRSTGYSIGYVELAYAFQTKLPFAYIQNAESTKFVEPTPNSILSAVASVVDSLPKPNEDWNNVTIVNAPGKNSYPLSSFTYILVYENLAHVVKSKEYAYALINLLYWMITEGQNYSASLFYIPLPDSIIEKIKDGLSVVKYNEDFLFKYENKHNHNNDYYTIPSWFKKNADWWIRGPNHRSRIH